MIEERFYRYLQQQLGRELSEGEAAVFAAVRMTDPALGSKKTKNRIRRGIGKLHAGVPLAEVLQWISSKAPARENVESFGDWAATQEFLNRRD